MCYILFLFLIIAIGVWLTRNLVKNFIRIYLPTRFPILQHSRVNTFFNKLYFTIVSHNVFIFNHFLYILMILAMMYPWYLIITELWVGPVSPTVDSITSVTNDKIPVDTVTVTAAIYVTAEVFTQITNLQGLPTAFIGDLLRAINSRFVFVCENIYPEVGAEFLDVNYKISNKQLHDAWDIAADLAQQAGRYVPKYEDYIKTTGSIFEPSRLMLEWWLLGVKKKLWNLFKKGPRFTGKNPPLNADYYDYWTEQYTSRENAKNDIKDRVRPAVHEYMDDLYNDIRASRGEWRHVLQTRYYWLIREARPLDESIYWHRWSVMNLEECLDRLEGVRPSTRFLRTFLVRPHTCYIYQNQLMNKILLEFIKNNGNDLVRRRYWVEIAQNVLKREYEQRRDNW